mmetsp:Transcript_9315/g.26599  ORF Transcript_9315/g.26599 Transcript_9315/m.26599 type:complete len:451 (-) Transcript_9315:266-1618(-)
MQVTNWMMRSASTTAIALLASSGSAVAAKSAASTRTANNLRGLQDQPTSRSSLAPLIPFDVQLAITSERDEVNTITLGDIVSDWMNDSFETKAKNEVSPEEVEFQAVALDRLEVSNRRALQDQADPKAKLFVASFTGATLWNRYNDSDPVDAEVVEVIQRATFLEDARLLTMLQAAPSDSGLGQAVIDVRAFVTPAGSGDGDDTDKDTNTNNNNDDGKNDDLELIIIVAIVVACLAFALLLFAVLWAYRSDKQRHEAFSATRNRNGRSDGSNNKTSAGTHSESDDVDRRSPRKSKMNNNKSRAPPALSDDLTSDVPPRVISPGSDYPESVISEDVSTSLTAYYNQSVGIQQQQQQHQAPAQRYRGHPSDGGPPNDAASMISMDSYGYSLDGYAPSLSGGPTQMGYPVGPINGQIKDPESLSEGELKDLQNVVDSIMDGEDITALSSKPSI